MKCDYCGTELKQIENKKTGNLTIVFEQCQNEKCKIIFKRLTELKEKK